MYVVLVVRTAEATGKALKSKLKSRFIGGLKCIRVTCVRSHRHLRKKTNYILCFNLNQAVVVFDLGLTLYSYPFRYFGANGFDIFDMFFYY